MREERPHFMNESFFLESYQDCKKAFNSLARKIQKKYEYSQQDKISFSKDIDQIDTFLIRRNKRSSKRLIILSSGVHGVEGFAGSAIQRNVMSDILKGELNIKADILMLHGINPYGFENRKRVNENNIDLNRNFFFKREKIPKKEKNKGYKRFSSFFTPRFPFTFWYLEYLIFIFRFTGIMLRIGIRKFTDALVNGQFEFKKGLYFGGKKPESVVKRLRKFFKLHLAQYADILHLDIHTGHGEEGGLLLIQNSELGTAEDINIQKISVGLPMLRPDSGKVFYKTAGDFTDFIGKIFPNRKNIYPLTVEIGTTGNLTFWKALKATFLIVAENRIRHHGSWFPGNRLKVDERFFRYFYPNSPTWREVILRKTLANFRILFNRFGNL
jgi:predicted deacylase